MKFKQLAEMAIKEAKETFESNWFIDNSDNIKFLDNFSSNFNKKLRKTIEKHCNETGKFYIDVENEISDRIFERISEMENVKNITGNLNQKFYSFYANAETGKNLTLENFADAFGLE